MDSKDDIQDSWGGRLDGEFYDTNEDEEDGSDLQMDSDNDDESDCGGFDAGADDDLLTSSRLPQANYTVLSLKDVRQRQEEAVSTITNVLSVSRTEAGILLRSFNWSVSEVTDRWFAEEESVRESLGLVHPRPQHEDKRIKLVTELKCEICFELHSLEKMKAAPTCGHFFCDTCWTAYIHTAINDGPGCLTLYCANPQCGAAIGEDMVLSLVSQEDGAKYTRYLLRSFVENNRTAKWCPAPGCEYAVEYVAGAGSFNVVCKCSHNFCWNCLEETHRPVDCETVAKWILKNSDESDNMSMNWVLANSKPCPKCTRPIEKDEGCMKMTCTPPCRFQFCWLCLGAWINHDERTVGSYACNRYETAKEDYEEEAETKREMIEKTLGRYKHYYERWDTNESLRAKALSDLQQMKAVQIEKLSNKQCQYVSQLEFVNEAWLQIVECQRVLKWTYVYGFYLADHEHLKRQFFEYLQREAEAHLKKLHQCAEKDLQVFLNGDSQNNFNEFRTKLTDLTMVTRTYFENLVRDLEIGLVDIE